MTPTQRNFLTVALCVGVPYVLNRTDRPFAWQDLVIAFVAVSLFCIFQWMDRVVARRGPM